MTRTGLPELFRSLEEYEAYISALVCSGAIPNATHIWWAIRPSDKYPTLELRAADCCTRIDDAMAIAALYRSLVRHLCRRPYVNADLDSVDRGVAVENKWRAQRYGVEATFASSAGAISVSELVEATLDAIAPDAEALGCLDEVNDCRRIVRQGTSADSQLTVFAGDGRTGSLDGVLRWIATTTVED